LLLKGKKMNSEPSFFDDVWQFNTVFNLPTPPNPVMVVTPEQRQALGARLAEFTGVLLDEVDEVNDIVKALATDAAPIDIVTDLADWLGDIIVYCTSEALRHGIPIEQVLALIMRSQYSKLDNGKPIYAHGKVQKGPGFVPPEQAIAELLAARILLNAGAQS
jgi:NTP pyrophosphatase (non-canonical NTP hydrolase)